MTRLSCSWVLAIGCGILGPACSSVQEEPAAIEATRSARPVAGVRVAYALDWDTRTSVAEHPALPSGTPVQTELQLRGTFVLESVDDQGLLAASWTALDSVSVEIFGQSSAFDRDGLLNLETLIRVDDDGATTHVYFPPDSTPLYRKLMGDLLAQLDLRSDGEHWHALARTPMGLGDAEYHRQGSTVERTIPSFQRVDGVAGVGADRWTIDDRLVVDLAADRLPDSLRADVSAWLSAPGSEAPILSSTTSLTLERLAVERVDPRAGLDLRDHVELDPYAAPDFAELERISAQAMAGETAIDDVHWAISMAGHGIRPRRGFLIKAAALLRAWPTLAEELDASLEHAPDFRTRAFIIDLLVSADTPQAQAVVRRSIERRRAAGDPRLLELVQHLALQHHPEPESVAQIVQIHDGAKAVGDDSLRRASVHVLGAQARASAGVHPVVTELAMQRIRNTLDAAQSPDDTLAALAGLGNAGSPDELWRVERYTEHEDPEIRKEAVDALRDLPGAHVDDMILAAVDDPEASVADQAVDVLSSNRMDAAMRAQLSGVAVLGAYHPDVGDDLFAVLSRNQMIGPEVVAALSAIRLRTTDERTRDAIDRRLLTE